MCQKPKRSYMNINICPIEMLSRKSFWSSTCVRPDFDQECKLYHNFNLGYCSIFILFLYNFSEDFVFLEIAFVISSYATSNRLIKSQGCSTVYTLSLCHETHLCKFLRLLVHLIFKIYLINKTFQCVFNSRGSSIQERLEKVRIQQSGHSFENY